MINPKFRLARPKNESSSIYMRFHINGKAFQYGIKETIKSKYWNSEDNRPSNGRELKGISPTERNHLTNIQSTIDKCVALVRNYESSIKLSTIKRWDFAELRQSLDQSIKDVIAEVKDTRTKDRTHIVEYADDLINRMKKGEVLFRKSQNEPMRRYSHASIKTFSEWVTVFKDYEKKSRKHHKWEDIDSKFEDKFLTYLGERYSPNTIGKHIKTLRTVMNRAKKEDLHSYLEYQNFGVPKVDTVSIYLTKDELKSIIALELNGNDNLIRDVFVFGCLVGQSFTDFTKIDKDSIVIDGDTHYWTINRQKGEKPVYVPLDNYAIQILRKYNWKFPKLSLQVFNRRIKEIARTAEIVEVINLSTIIKGETVKTKIEKCEMVSSHTARRTAITNWYLDGIPIRDIMVFSGHTKEATLLKYIKLTKEQTAKRHSNYSFFGTSTSHLKVV